jgi:hypothetical protein
LIVWSLEPVMRRGGIWLGPEDDWTAPSPDEFKDSWTAVDAGEEPALIAEAEAAIGALVFAPR